MGGAVEGVCDVTTTVRAGAKLGHGAEVAFFERSEAVKAHAEETGIEGGGGTLGGKLAV